MAAQVVSPSTGKTLPYTGMSRAEEYEYSAFRQGMAWPDKTQFMAGSRRYIPLPDMTATEYNEYKCWIMGKAAAATSFISPSTQRKLPLSNMTAQEVQEYEAWELGKQDPFAERFVSTSTPKRYLPDLNMTEAETYQYMAWRIGQGKEWVYEEPFALELALHRGLATPPLLSQGQPNIPAAYDTNVMEILELANRYLAMRTEGDIVVE